jgi:hypothetical protein
MNVICIDNSDGLYGVASSLLKVGETYTVIGQSEEGGYILSHCPYNPKTGNKLAFKSRRFIPCSDMDENEFVLTNQKVEND